MKRAAIFAGLFKLFQLLLFVGLSARAADATVTVNKTFSPASVAIGASSTVTIFLQNTDTGADAHIMSLRDDIGSMGKAILDTHGATTGVCTGVDAVSAPPIPTLANNVYSLGPFLIPKAARVNAPATCTFTFTVLGNQAGNGFNTIAAGDVVVNPATDNPSAITQTLTITSVDATIATRGNVTVIAPAAANLRYIIRNPAAGIPLTNAGFGIDVNSTTAYSIGGVTSTCGATLTTAPGAKTLLFSGATIPAGGTCVVTIPVTGAAGAVVNTVFNGNSLTDDQLVTNPDAVSAAASFSDKKPVLAKWFTPPFVQPAGNIPPAITQSRLSIHITNPVPTVPLTNAGITDTLPAGITLVSAPSPQCGGVVTTTGNVLKLSDATIGAVPCLLTAFVTATTGALNFVDKAAFTSDGVAGAANDAQARLNVTGAGGTYFMSKRALGSAPNAPIGSYGVNTPFQFELDFSSIAGSEFSGGTIADDFRTLPIPTRIVDDGDAHKPTSTNCGTPVFTDTDGGTFITVAGVTIPAGATCRVKFWAQFTSTTGTALTGANTAQATFGGIAQTANASVTELPALYVQNYTTSNQGLVNQPLTVAGQIHDDAATPDTGAVAVFKLGSAAHPHSVVLAPAPNFTFSGCPSGLAAANITIDSSREFFTVTVPGTIGATCTIGYDVINEAAGAAGAGTFVSGDSTYAGNSTGGMPKATTGVGFAEFSTSSITPSKQFIPNNIQAGAPATAQISLAVAGVFGSRQTVAKNVQFTDTLPAGITFAANPNPTFSGCGATPAAAIAGSAMAFTGITLTARGASPDLCSVQFQVTSSLVGAPPPNVIAAGSITTATGGITNALAAQASLTVVNGIGVQKTFVAPMLPIGSTDFARFLLSNSVTAAPLSGGLTDRLPSNLQLNSTTLGPTIPGDTVGLCGGTVTSGAVGVAGATIALGGLTVPPYNSATGIPGQCAVYLALGGSASAMPGTAATNTIEPGDVAIGGIANLVGASASVNFTAASNVGLSNAFLPTTILSGATSVLTISVSNTAANAAGLTGLNVSDVLPPNVTIAATPNASTTCSGGSLTALAGTASIGLAGGSLAANATCTIAVSVSGTLAGIYTNTIPANAVVSNQGATNGAPASAALNVGNTSGVTLAQSFAPALIAVNGISVVQVTVSNTLSGSVPLSAVQLDDALPPNVVIAPTPNASTTCPGGVVSAVAGGTFVGLAGGSVPANATCTIAVSVTSGSAGIYVNTIPANALNDAQGSTNADPALATLNVGNAPGVGIAKSFMPATIPAFGTSVLTISLVNPAASALTGMALTDALPAGVRVAPAPNAATTCGAGVVAAVAGGAAVSLSGGVVPANATCAIAVSVTASTAGVYSNTIPANALADAQTSTNGLPASAVLNVANASGVALANAFGPTIIAPHGTSALTITLANSQPNAVPLTALNLVDNLPANLIIAATPNASTTCGGGAVGAASSGTVVTLSGVNMGPHSTCTLTVSVTGTIPNTYTNTIPAGAIRTAQGAANAVPATADLIIGQPALGVTKTSVPSAAAVSPGETIAYTVSVKNGGTQAETNAHLVDVMKNATLVPGSVTIDGQPVPDQVLTAGQPFGTIPIGATTTLVYRAAVNLTASAGATVTNAATIAGDQPCTLAACTATSPLNTVAPPVLNATKLIDGVASESVLAGQTVTYTIAIANTGTSPTVNATIADPLPNGVTVTPGTVTLNGVPLPAAAVSGQTLTIPIGEIAAGTSAVAAFNAKLGSTAENTANTASAMAAGLARAVQSTTATAHRVPAALTVSKTASAATASAGDRVDYQIVVAPVGGVAYGATTLVDSLPGGEVYAPGTARVNGKPAAPAENGHRLTWTLPALGAQATIVYSTVITPGVQQNAQLTNVVDVTAVAPGRAGLGRGSGSASVLVTQSTFGSCYPITGRVYLDRPESGHFEDPDVGVPGVNIYLDNGENVTTDAFGRYDFPCVHPGMHALRLDQTTLPAGAFPYDDRNIDSEKSTRRLVHHIYDTTIIEDINFAVRGTHGGRSQ